MHFKKHIPNILTCCNLLCGCAGIVHAFSGNLFMASCMIMAGTIFDFADGFAARMLHVSSEIGKQLDSLSDIVTFGVLPGSIMYELLVTVYIESHNDYLHTSDSEIFSTEKPFLFFALSAFSITVFSAIRLARFNTDSSDKHTFTGLPTPANALLISSLALISDTSSQRDTLESFISSYVLTYPFLFTFIPLSCFLLVMPVEMFSLKFKNVSLHQHRLPMSFAAVSILLLLLLKLTAIPIVIVCYILISLFQHFKKKLVNNNP
ncbi:MAG: CDP-alcohol phosphatidyltransferase family protein [Cytophagaceae bacterium]|nr:CDP-alcohol phosphatidyltransferase family protein [Cytophagaceae bacterium]MDW8456968.1 CDP-alcohol phosphatidyltransferase family protein [Cytophagaceae bacterium]